MSEFAEVSAKVHSALSELRDSLRSNDHRSVILATDYETSHPKWLAFIEALREVAHVVRDPRPRQGLAAIWLRQLVLWSDPLEKAGANHRTMWPQIASNFDSLQYLIYDGWHGSFRFLKATSTRPTIIDLVTTERSPTLELEDLAKEWGDKAPGLPATLEIYPSTGDYGQFVDRAGLLFRKAIDWIEIDKKWLSDSRFCSDVWMYVEVPSSLVWPRLNEISGAGLREMIAKYMPHDVTANTLDPSKGYSSPKNYHRDKWIYENIHLHDLRTLSEMFDEEAIQKKWRAIGSRNGFKDAADRYCEFKGLPAHRFPDERGG